MLTRPWRRSKQSSWQRVHCSTRIYLLWLILIVTGGRGDLAMFKRGFLLAIEFDLFAVDVLLGLFILVVLGFVDLRDAKWSAILTRDP